MSKDQQGFSQIILIFSIVGIIGLGILAIKQKNTPPSETSSLPSQTPGPTETPSTRMRDLGNGYTQYQNLADKYEVTVPSSWIEAPNPSQTMIFSSHEQKGYGIPYDPPETISLRISKNDFSENSSYLDQVFSSKMNQKLVSDKFDTIKLAELTIDGLPAVKVSVSGENKPTESLPTIVYYIKSNNDYYELNFNANNFEVLDSKDNGLTIYQIADSFKLIN